MAGAIEARIDNAYDRALEAQRRLRNMDYNTDMAASVRRRAFPECVLARAGLLPALRHDHGHDPARHGHPVPHHHRLPARQPEGRCLGRWTGGPTQLGRGLLPEVRLGALRSHPRDEFGVRAIRPRFEKAPRQRRSPGPDPPPPRTADPVELLRAGGAMASPFAAAGRIVEGCRWHAPRAFSSAAASPGCCSSRPSVCCSVRLRRLPRAEGGLAYRGIVSLATRLGYGPHPSQTEYEYAGSLSEAIPTCGSDLYLVADARVESAYGQRVLGDGAARRAATRLRSDQDGAAASLVPPATLERFSRSRQRRRDVLVEVVRAQLCASPAVEHRRPTPAPAGTTRSARGRRPAGPASAAAARRHGRRRWPSSAPALP